MMYGQQGSESSTGICVATPERGRQPDGLRGSHRQVLHDQR